MMKEVRRRITARLSGNSFPINNVNATLLITFIFLIVAVDSQRHYTDHFPAHYDYDPFILDPEAVFGSPYGGFSRNTASRLASLPLLLPPVKDEHPGEPEYTEMRDREGRLFICRVYHEDELEAASRSDSMFNMPKHRDFSLQDDDLLGDGDDEEEDAPSELSSSSEDTNGADQQVFGSMSEAILGAINVAKVKVVETARRLAKIEGICAQIHKGWWSYEWCHGSAIAQFHVHVEETDTKTEISLQSVTSLGKHAGRQIITDFGNSHANLLAEGREEFTRVQDTFINGDLCEENGKPRATLVTLQCCSEKVLHLEKAAILIEGRPQESEDLRLVELSEDPDKICHYNVTVCTSFLCADYKDEEAERMQPTSPKARPEDESVREVIQRNLNNRCLMSSSGGWWTYEVCHGKHIRQFHEATFMDRITGMASKSVESANILGNYDKEALESFPNEDEWKYIVNVTDETKGIGKGRGDTSFGGNGAYFVQEYTAGDVCDHTDVTDAAIKAGNVGKGGIERASTVRYACGKRFDVSVNEDSTCHYVVDVTVPDLCRHPLFKAPISKHKIVKCLPADEV